MKVYREYKESNEDWMGNIPSAWLRTRFKYLVSKKNKTSNTYLPCGSISFGSVVFKDSEKLTDETKLAYQEVLNGEFLINPLNLNYDLKSLRTALSDKDVIVSSGYIVLNSNSKTINGYLKWLLFVFDVRHMKTLGAGIRQTITSKDIGDCYVYVPSIIEQKNIANYLEIETTRIDTLISEKENFIKLLQEKHKVLISQVVTKGLNSNAKMKNSGVDWIGSIPEEWNATPLKHIITTRKGAAFKTDDFCDHGTPLVKASDIKKKSILTPKVFLPVEFKDSYPAAVLKTHELILSTVGSTPEVVNSAVGQIGLVPENINGALLNQNTVVFSAIKSKVTPLYLQYLVQLSAYREHLDLNAHGTANQASLNITDMVNFSFSIPPLPEQTKIVHFLSEKLNILHDLDSETNKSIELLKEHRTALIIAAVTGKIDVRENT